MHPTSIDSLSPISLRGQAIPGAEDRQRLIAGFDQKVFSRSRVLCIGAGGLISQAALTVVRKGIGQITLVDHDLVEPSNLNRQRFYIKDVGRNKALALAENLLLECTAETEIRGYPMRFEEAMAREMDLDCEAVVCGVDNNPARVAASRYFRQLGVPVVFAAVSRDGDHGYVFIQESRGPCIACLFPDVANDDHYPCPGTPAIADILQAVGSLAIYAIDTLLMQRRRTWNFRTVTLSDGSLDASTIIPIREGCGIFAPKADSKRTRRFTHGEVEKEQESQ